MRWVNFIAWNLESIFNRKSKIWTNFLERPCYITLRHMFAHLGDCRWRWNELIAGSQGSRWSDCGITAGSAAALPANAERDLGREKFNDNFPASDWVDKQLAKQKELEDDHLIQVDSGHILRDWPTKRINDVIRNSFYASNDVLTILGEVFLPPGNYATGGLKTTPPGSML